MNLFFYSIQVQPGVERTGGNGRFSKRRSGSLVHVSLCDESDLSMISVPSMTSVETTQSVEQNYLETPQPAVIEVIVCVCVCVCVCVWVCVCVCLGVCGCVSMTVHTITYVLFLTFLVCRYSLPLVCINQNFSLSCFVVIFV